MQGNNLRYLCWLVGLVVAQMLVFNHLHLGGYIVPLPFVYLVLLFPTHSSRGGVLLWAFACGLLTDLVSLTPGVGAAALTLVAALQQPLLRHVLAGDDDNPIHPSKATLGLWPYMRYTMLLTFLFTALYFLLQYFTFYHLGDLLLTWLGSWLMTTALCWLIEAVRVSKS